MKKIFSLFVIAVMFGSVLPMPTYAQSSEGGFINLPLIIRGGGGGSGGRRHADVPIASTNAGQVLGASTGFQFGKNLSVGMSGDDVTELQNRLTSEGVYSGPITGYFGPLTMAGVKAFQAKYSIDQVGAVGPITLAKLNDGSGAVLGAQTSTTATEQIKTILGQLKAQALALLAKLNNLSQ